MLETSSARECNPLTEAWVGAGFNPPISREPSQAAAPVAGPSREADKAPPPEPLTAKEALQKYLQGQHPPPWEQLGYKQQPVLGGECFPAGKAAI